MKLQAPSPKHQRSSKPQARKAAAAGSFEIWNLEFVWDLELGIWSFPGAWSLELGASCRRCFFLLSALLPMAIVSCSKSQGEPSASARDDALPVTVAKVELVPMDRMLPVVGTLFAKDEATLGAEVEGKVEKTRVDFGDR